MKRAIAVLMLSFLLLAGGCAPALPPGAAAHLMRFSVNTAQDSPSGIAAQRFADLVQERSEGRMVLVPSFDNGLGDESAVLEQLALGGVDLGLISLKGIAGEYEEMNVFCLPYLFTDRNRFFATVEADLCGDLLEQLKDDSLHAITWFDQGALSFCSSKWALISPDSFLKQTAAVTAGEIACDAVTAFGAEALLINTASISAAYDAHLVSIAEVSLLDYLASGTYASAPYLLLDEHICTPALLLIGQPAMRRLSEEEAALLWECAVEAAAYGRLLQEEAEAAALETLAAKGISVSVPTDAQTSRFREATLRVYARYTPVYRSFYDKIVAFLRRDQSASPMQ